MVISKIFMGLGNQMFQYAAGRSLSLHKNVPFAVETSSYNGYALRKYELEDFFEISPAHASLQQLDEYRLFQPVKVVWNKLFSADKMRYYACPYEEQGLKRTLLKLNEVLLPGHKRKTYLEPEYHFNRNFFNTPDNVFLIGYFMSSLYFKDVEETINKDFTVRPDLIKHLKVIDNDIANANSVSIHIRRADFTLAHNSELHGVIPVEFYYKAIETIAAKITSPHFYIFSDDINWVQQNLKTDYATTFVSNFITKQAVEDFYLMSQCKHNIIANSSFSWWAAYLNKNKQKMVVAPQKWYNRSPYNYKDVYPAGWIVLP